MINALGMKQSGDTKLGKSGCRRKNLGVFRASARKPAKLAASTTISEGKDGISKTENSNRESRDAEMDGIMGMRVIPSASR